MPESRLVFDTDPGKLALALDSGSCKMSVRSPKLPFDKWPDAGTRNNLTQNTVLLARTHNLGVHSHQVVVDGVLLLLLRFLYVAPFCQ